jgi:hypothetical protein
MLKPPELNDMAFAHFRQQRDNTRKTKSALSITPTFGNSATV